MNIYSQDPISSLLPLMHARLYLVKSSIQVYENVFQLLGIEAVREMWIALIDKSIMEANVDQLPWNNIVSPNLTFTLYYDDLFSQLYYLCYKYD